MFVPERLATAELASIALDMAPFAIEVAFPTLVTTPVKLAFVVTFPAVRLAAVPLSPVPKPVNEEPVIVPEEVRFPVMEVSLAREMFPVLLPPSVNVCLFVVWILPEASRAREPDKDAI